jgi:Uma2 family endonuclease
MSLRTTSEILDAAEHLPEGATLIIPQLVWEDYERLLEGLAERPHLRVSYDSGRLEIVSPSREHEEFTRLIDRLVYVFAGIFGLEVEPRGSATWKRRSQDKGVEPDGCYYIRNAARIIGKRVIDLESDLPPDVVVEVDITSTSLHKFPIYAALSVPEIWRYDGQGAYFYELTGGRYVVISESRFLPPLTGPILAEAIEISKTRGQETAIRVFRRRIQSRRTQTEKLL